MVICNRCLLGNNIDLFKYLYDFLGTQGADLPIQLKYPAMSVGYNLTMGEAVGITLLLGYFFTLGIMGITLFMSALLKNTYAVIIVAFLLIIIPTFLSLDTGGYVWSHVLSLLPPKIADFFLSVVYGI